MILLLLLLLPLLNCACAGIAVRQEIVYESSDGHVFVTMFNATRGSPISSSTPAGSSISQSTTNSTPVSISLSPSSTMRTTTKTSAAEPATNSFAKPSSSGKSAQASPTSSTSRPLPTATISTTSPYRTMVQASASALSSLSFMSTITSAPKPTGNGTSLGSWPASVTYCLQSNGQPIIMVGYVATGTNGVSTITNTSPSQSMLSATVRASCSGEIAVFSAGTTTTIELSTLPVASTFSQAVAAQTLSVNGTPVIYSPMTLPGYSNTEPVEISTSFVETVNGQTTTQSGWWLIGPYGRIDPPNNTPWRTGSGNLGCIGGPLFCNAPCGHVNVGGGWFVHIPLIICTPDITGPPGWPGGPIVSGPGEPINGPPPYPKSPDDPMKHDPSNCDKDGIECSVSTTTATRSSTSSQTPSDTASKTPYFLIAGTNAIQSVIEQALQTANPESNGLFPPDVGKSNSGGPIWMSVDLTPQQASSMASRSDVNLVMTCASITFSVDGPSPTVMSLESTPSFTTSTSNTTTATFTPKHRRLVGNPGRPISRQRQSPKDLSVLAWAPDVPSVDDVDYIYYDSAGEDTWVYLLDTGMSSSHNQLDQNYIPNSPGDPRKTNLDDDWIWAPLISEHKVDVTGHGTCMASKICGFLDGPAKKTIIIPVIFGMKIESLLAVLQILVSDIESRRRRDGPNKQALPGRTNVIMPWSFLMTNYRYIAKFKDYLDQIFKLGLGIYVEAGNQHGMMTKDGRGSYPFVSTWLPAALASEDFPVVRVGAADTAGRITPRSQQGDVYAPGVSGSCADWRSFHASMPIQGSAPAVSVVVGQMQIDMGTGYRFNLGNDTSRHPYIFKEYLVTGRGANIRQGGNVRVIWNGLDGDIYNRPYTATYTISTASSASPTISPASSASPTTSTASSASPTISPASSASPTTSTASSASPTISTTSSISPTTSPSSSAIPTQIANSKNKINIDVHYSEISPCDQRLSNCNRTYHVNARNESGSLPPQECGGVLAQGSDWVRFRVKTLTGTGYDLAYYPNIGIWGAVDWNIGKDPFSVQCSRLIDSNVAGACGPTKRSEYPDTTFHTVVSYYQWASCVLNIS